ncbi:Poly(A) polymerase [Glugoides intestinalis]
MVTNFKNVVKKSRNSSGEGEKAKRQYRSVPINQILKLRGNKEPNLNLKLNEELLLAYSKIKLSEKEIEIRKRVFELFKKVIEEKIDCKVEAHGSFRTETMVFGSDIDITVLMNNKSDDKRNKIKNEAIYKPHANQKLAEIVKIIEKNNISIGPILQIKNARVPVVKCVDKEYKCKIDIVIDRYDGIETANFVVEKLKERPYLKSIITLLKYFLKRRHLSEVIRGGLCSYAQFLLVLNFVQIHPLIQSGSINVEENLGVIFMDFFQLYGIEFPFERATISVYDAKYKPNRSSQINIEDPCNLTNNVAIGCTVLPAIREIFGFSYKIMAAAFSEKVSTNKAIGDLWLRIDEEELDNRSKI